jgi:putative phosphoesterase
VKILVISDIHSNYPALEAVDRQVKAKTFDMIINGGDSTVYATFPNETLDWLREHRVVSILGNTDIKVLKLLEGKTFKKPRSAEKRIMYTWTADHLTPENKMYLAEIDNRIELDLEGHLIGLFHGSPANDNEHLFFDTPTTRFRELTRKTGCSIIITGHSHSPFHKKINNVHFINPGSVGRMFDKNPDTSYAVLELAKDRVQVRLFRCPYDIEKVVSGLRKNLLPPIYEEMFRQGRKLN